MRITKIQWNINRSDGSEGKREARSFGGCHSLRCKLKGCSESLWWRGGWERGAVQNRSVIRRNIAVKEKKILIDVLSREHNCGRKESMIG